MSLEFHETLTITVPDVEEQLSAFSESAYSKDHGLIIEIAAIHEGMTANYNFYGEEALEGSLESWVSPYPKPIILNHDTQTEPVGRVMAAKMETEADGTPYVKLRVAVKDPNAIAKVMDQRYLTGSVGGRAEEALCSVCEADWAKASMFDLPCKHQRGKTYKGKMAYLKLGELSFKEYSFVNVPADQRSTVRALQTAAAEADGDDDWVRPVRVFALDMNDQEIVEFSESENRNVLEGMRPKESTPAYMQWKGAFLMALDNFKESDVDPTLLEGDEDILDITTGLSADLAAAAENDNDAEEPTTATADDDDNKTSDAAADDVDPAATATGEEPAATADGDEDTATASDENPDEAGEDKDKETTDEPGASPAAAGEPVASDGPPEGQEKPDAEDNVPATRDTADSDNDEGTVSEADAAETDLNEALQTLESRVNELTTQNQTLLETNAKLKTALKHSLAERVVDTKIMLGLVEQEGRDAALADHTKRSASSLADTLRDLVAMPSPPTHTREFADLPKLTEAGSAIPDGTNAALTEGEEENTVEELDPEQVLFEALMGKRQL